MLNQIVCSVQGRTVSVCFAALAIVACSSNPSGTGGGAGGSAGQGSGNGGVASSGGAASSGGVSGGGGTSVVASGGKPGAGGTTVSAGGAGAGGTSAGIDASTVADGPGPDTAVVVGNPRRVVLCDEGNKRISLVDLEKPTAIWQKNFSVNSLRDIQLIGGDLLGVAMSEGYMELDLKTGAIKKEVKGFGGVESFRRLPNGNTILGSEADGTTLQELDSKDQPVAGHKVSFPALQHFRMFRRTPQGTFLVGAGNKLAEVNWDKQIVWDMDFTGSGTLYVYQGLRLADGTIAVTQGYGSSLVIVDPVAKKILTTIGGKDQPEAATIQPNFYAGFQVLANGHFVIANWEGHGGGNGGKGIQLLEYDATGKLVWKWKQDPALVSSLHHVIVLDGLDTTKLHDDVNGILAPVTK